MKRRIRERLEERLQQLPALTIELSVKERWLLAYTLYYNMADTRNPAYREGLRVILDKLGGAKFLNREEIPLLPDNRKIQRNWIRQ